MIVSINQPAYHPWLGYFERILVSDLHIVLDHVQFEKNSFVNRNRVRTADGSSWLTTPVRTKGRFGAPIDELEIAAVPGWRRKHWETIRQAYSGSPFFDDLAPFLESVYSREWTHLLPLCSELSSWIGKQLGISTKVVSSSTLSPSGRKDELVLELCKKVGATTYLSGSLGRRYLREELFESAGIQVVYQDFKHPIYSQRYEPFMPAMATIDLLMNHGPRSADILSASQEVKT